MREMVAVSSVADQGQARPGTGGTPGCRCTKWHIGLMCKRHTTLKILKQARCNGYILWTIHCAKGSSSDYAPRLARQVQVFLLLSINIRVKTLRLRISQQVCINLQYMT